MSDLLAAAESITRELICCDVFDRLSDKPVSEWSDTDRAERRGHDICYWGAAARALVLERGDAKAKHVAREAHPATMIGRK